MKNILLFSLLILVFASGCHEIFGRREGGSGNITPQTRTVPGFRKVEVSGAIDVYVKQDSVTSVKVETDDNLLQYVVVHTSGSTLEIYTERGFNLRPTSKIKVFVSNPTFDGFEVQGASKVISENEITASDRISLSVSGASEGRLQLNTPKVIVEATGASNANISGRAKDLEASASGASHIRGYDLLTENTVVDLSGASHADVSASVSLAGEASGASHVNYKGNIGHNVRTSGASHVNKNND